MGKKKGAGKTTGRAKQAQKAKKFSSSGGSGGKARSAASKKFFPDDGQFRPAPPALPPLRGTAPPVEVYAD